MPAKKKSKNKKKKVKTKITPAMPKPKNKLVDFSTLHELEGFLLNGELWIVENENEQSAMNFVSGGYVEGLCGTMVEPVNIEIKWSRIK